MFGLEAGTTIREAAKLLEEEGFSRVPVYEDNIDNIVGVLMYKDVLGKYMEYEAKNNDPTVLEAPISSIQKTPLYTPETKKISDLLQEFKKKHTHLAIVVDEYGGTEGIITIEDILEDIVGEIADEYDVEEEFFTSLPNGTWIVDPRISILDAEEQLGIVIPQEGDYDTLGGYIFHCAGEIPARGFKIQSNEFELEVLKSNDRMVQKVRIRPLPTNELYGREE
jgi:CBS domain containing-hemolysin-like protein